MSLLRLLDGLDRLPMSLWLPVKHQLWSSRAVILVLPFLLGAESIPASSPSGAAAGSHAVPPQQQRPSVHAKTAVVPTPIPRVEGPSTSASPSVHRPLTTAPSAAFPPAPAVAPPPPKSTGNQPPISLRVAIAQDAEALTVGAAAPTVLLTPAGDLLAELVPGTMDTVLPAANGLQLGTVAAPNVVWIKPRSAADRVYVNGHWYRGAVQVIRQDQTLLAVNHVDLEPYLYSVVGAEMPAYWPLAALKAQAIAARSYALVHIARPASPDYDLGNTPRWQAYPGVETETHTTQTAVDETGGLVLSHRGGVVESLYGASDDIVKESHNGFGMSQEGAGQMAQRGFNYQQILTHFYQGVRLARLQQVP